LLHLAATGLLSPKTCEKVGLTAVLPGLESLPYLATLGIAEVIQASNLSNSDRL